MSTNYAISSFIKLDDIKALSKIHAIDEVKINYINEMGQSLNFIRDRAGNYLCFYLHNMVGSTVIAPKDQRKYVTSFDRFGSNNVQLILDIIEQECQVQIIPEHEDSYDSISKNSYENFKNKDKPQLKTYCAHVPVHGSMRVSVEASSEKEALELIKDGQYEDDNSFSLQDCETTPEDLTEKDIDELN